MGIPKCSSPRLVATPKLQIAVFLERENICIHIFPRGIGLSDSPPKKSFYWRGWAHKNRDLCVVVAKNTWFPRPSLLGAPQVPSDKLSPAKKVILEWEGPLKTAINLQWPTQPERRIGPPILLTAEWVRQFFNGSMSVALRLKCQSELCYNLAMRKSDEHTKHPRGSLIQKFIRYYPSFVVTEGTEKKAWTESTILDRQKEINRRMMRKTDTEHDIHFFLRSFFVVVLARACSGSSSLRVWAPTFFPLFYPAPPLMALLLELLTANHHPRPFCCWYISIFNLGVCCYPDRDLGNL